MNNPYLRPILTDLQDRLSDSDRQRFDLYMQNDVPRSIEAESTLTGILKLFQSLLDQNKIDEKDLTLLINGLEQIQCFDAVHLLTGHQHQMLLTGHTQSIESLASLMPSHSQQTSNNYGDGNSYATTDLLLPETNCSDNQNRSGNMILSNEGAQKRSTSRQRCFGLRSLKKRYILIPSILLMFAILIFFLSPKKCNDILPEKNAIIEQLNKTLIEMKQEKKITLIKAGRRFGGLGGADFDDSLLPMFTDFHYLSGFIIFDINNFDSCQFIYTSSRENQSQIESSTYGWHVSSMNRTQKYQLDADERIEKVQIQSLNERFSRHDQSTFVLNIIKGWRFTTTKGRTIPPNFILIGNGVEVESYPGYTVGYVTGNVGSKIDQLQFFWYRTET